MVTEQTGIGRNWLASVMTRVLRGYVAAGISLGPILDGKFNGRLSQKLLAFVDEVREGTSEKRYARAEALKRIVTEQYRHIDPKYGLQTVEKNCCRWLMFSNHFDALPFDNNDRRIIVIRNPTERKSPGYYEHLYSLLNDTEFLGSVWKYLQTLDLTGFKPGEHAPMNDAKKFALDEQATDLEKAMQVFRDEWPGSVATTNQIRNFIHTETDFDIDRVNNRHFSAAIKRAGMMSANRSIKIERRTERLVIVRDSTVEEVKAMTPDALRKMVESAAETAAVAREKESLRFASELLAEKTQLSMTDLPPGAIPIIGHTVSATTRSTM